MDNQKSEILNEIMHYCESVEVVKVGFDFTEYKIIMDGDIRVSVDLVTAPPLPYKTHMALYDHRERYNHIKIHMRVGDNVEFSSWLKLSCI